MDGANGVNSNPSVENLSPIGISDSSRVATPDVVDDPGKFESAKQRKTILLEGLKKFNFKPKRVRSEKGVLIEAHTF